MGSSIGIELASSGTLVGTVEAFIFDLDGVVTDTASVHARAWKQLFDEYLTSRRGPSVAPFTDDDYRRSVDGRSRVDGVVAFLASRDIALPLGTDTDPSDGDTAWALANRKNELFLAELDKVGVQVFPSSLALLRALRAAGARTAVVTASRNAAHVLRLGGVADFFDVRVDGIDAARLGLQGKPDPATFLEAAHRLGVDPADSVVFEDALAGVAAGRRGGFGLVVGVDRVGQEDALAGAGADVVVGDLAELRVVDQPQRDECSLCLPSVADSEWVLAYEGVDQLLEGNREALLTLANGYMSTRGAMSEATAGGAHYPGSYAAGVYNRLVSNLAGADREDETVVNLPNWLPLTFRVAGGEWIAPDTHEMVHHHVALDLRSGVLLREFVVADDEGRHTRVRQRRLVSMASPHLATIEMRIEPQNWSGRLEIRSVIDGDVANTNVDAFAGLASRHLNLQTKGASAGAATAWLVAETSQSKVRIAQAARTRIYESDAEPIIAEVDVIDTPSSIGHQLSVEVATGDSLTVEKVVAIYTSRDHAISEPLIAARDQLDQAGRFGDLASAHSLTWEHLWRRFRIGVHGVEQGLRTVNVNIFHVLQTLSPHTADLDAGVPARGLHGEGYRGHVFWDELFVFPILNFRLPELTRALLLYRHRRLAKARHHAAQVGSRGALFPWQSGSDGREETPTRFFNPRSGRWIPDHSRRQYHVNLAIAYNVWHFWEATGDIGFLTDYGAELLIEIARFWVGFATYDAADDRYDIRGVMGPDEFHDGYPDRPGQGIDNNAYVNVMTAWTLSRARDAHDILGHRRCTDLWERLGLSTDELDRWDHVSRRLRIPFLANGLIAQFEGYEELRELDWRAYRDRYGDIRRLDLVLEAEGDTPTRYKASKQADALMLFYLLSAEEITTLFDRLGYPFDTATIPATIDYYLARTSNGSTLSRIAHAWVLARANRPQSWALLHDALGSDLFDTQGRTTREGIHLGAMAGSLDILQRCYTGLEVHGGALDTQSTPARRGACARLRHPLPGPVDQHQRRPRRHHTAHRAVHRTPGKGVDRCEHARATTRHDVARQGARRRRVAAPRVRPATMRAARTTTSTASAFVMGASAAARLSAS